MKKRVIKALDGIDIFLHQGETTALIGESGCGKTTLAKILLGFYSIDSGKIFFEGKDISDLKHNLPIIRKNIQIVFQNPYLSFDPNYSVFSTLYEVLSTFSKVSKKDAYTVVGDILKKVGLDTNILFRYSHQLSGGQLQRVSIARALIKNPRVIILDEPMSSLDVSTTKKMISLLNLLKQKISVTYLFISHNLKLVRNIAHYVFIMYQGKIVECGPKESIYNNPLHPYTRLLLEASEYKLKELFSVRDGEKEGCLFRIRCNDEALHCKIEPRLREVEPNHFVSCHHV